MPLKAPARDRQHKAASGAVSTTAQGQVSCVFSTFGVVDRDGDVTLKGAIRAGKRVVISGYNHSAWGPGAMPVGEGVIRVAGDEAILDGRFFLDTTDGRDTFNTVRGLGDLCEWSYGFDVLAGSPNQHGGKDLRQLEVHEVSPVLKGAGIATRTLALKGTHTSRLREPSGRMPGLTPAQCGILNVARRTVSTYHRDQRRQKRGEHNVVLKAAALLAERELERMGELLDELVALDDGQYWYTQDEPADPEVRKACAKAMRVCAVDLGVDELPDLLFYGPESAAEKSYRRSEHGYLPLPWDAFCWPEPLRGLCQRKERRIWVGAGLDLHDAENTTAHELAHWAGREEIAAQDYAAVWRSRTRGIS